MTFQTRRSSPDFSTVFGIASWVPLGLCRWGHSESQCASAGCLRLASRCLPLPRHQPCEPERVRGNTTKTREDGEAAAGPQGGARGARRLEIPADLQYGCCGLCSRPQNQGRFSSEVASDVVGITDLHVPSLEQVLPASLPTTFNTPAPQSGDTTPCRMTGVTLHSQWSVLPHRAHVGAPPARGLLQVVIFATFAILV